VNAKEEEVVRRLERLNSGVCIAFMLLLSSKKDLTFSYSDSLLEAFPFELYELTATKEGNVTTFTLIPSSEHFH